jgi:hypothetical protein
VPTWTVEVNNGDRSAFLFFEEQWDEPAASAAATVRLKRRTRVGVSCPTRAQRLGVAQERSQWPRE